MEIPHLACRLSPMLLMKASEALRCVRMRDLKDGRSKISSQQGKRAFKWGEEEGLSEQSLEGGAEGLEQNCFLSGVEGFPWEWRKGWLRYAFLTHCVQFQQGMESGLVRRN